LKTLPIYCVEVALYETIVASVAQPHHFFAAPAPGKNFYAAPAPTTFLKQTKVNLWIEDTFSSDFCTVKMVTNTY
jgi:hypothetical protein